MSDIELSYLLRLVFNHIKELERTLDRNTKYWSNPDDDVMYYKKITLVQAELEHMQNIKRYLSDMVAKKELLEYLSLNIE